MKNTTASKVAKLYSPLDRPCAPIACSQCGVYQLCLPLGLNSADLTLLESVVKRKQIFKKGQLLFRAGDRFDHIYALRSGSIKSYVSTPDGRVQITGFHIAGDLLGLSALESGQFSCAARALETASVCCVEAEKIDELAQQIPSIQYQLLRIMSGHIRQDDELMLMLGRRSAEERLAEYLIGLSRRFAARNYSATQFRLSMSRGEIGNYLGIAEETVCRILARFADSGIIVTNRRHVQLVDLKQLEVVAQLNSA